MVPSDSARSRLRLAALAFAVIVAGGAAGVPRASAIPPPRPGETPEFSISAYFMGEPGYLRESSLKVNVWGGAQYDSLAKGHARIAIPEGIQLVSGDTLRDVLLSPFVSRPPSDRGWSVTIRPMRTGTYTIRGDLTVDEGPERGRDESGFELSLDVRADTTIFAPTPRVTRFEKVREGRRFRYADGLLVPIDSTETFLESEITSKPRVVREARAIAPRGAGTPRDGVAFVAIVGADGSLIDAMPVEEPGSLGFGPEILGPAEEALASFRFAPAIAQGRAVPDYLALRVRFKAPGR
ncbi:MAG TPA: hypothetical protein VF363_06085 [Candidatus Eisenbacteria bacterium]